MLDSFDEHRAAGADRRASAACAQAVLIRVTPGVAGRTHDGDLDRAGGLEVRLRRSTTRARAIERLRGSERARPAGPAHAHRLAAARRSTPFRPAVEAIATLGDFPVYNLGGGLGVAYTADAAAAVDRGLRRRAGATPRTSCSGAGKRLLIEPGRALVANACVTLYTVETVKRNVSTWVGVDGGMSDNLRPMLYGSATRRTSPTASAAATASAATSPASTASRAT